MIKWSTDRLHSSSSDKKSSAVLHTMWVMLRMCSRIEQLWAMLCTGLTASASSFLLLSPFSNTLVDVRPFLRSEVIYTGRGGGRVYCNATHTTLSRTTLTSCLEGLRGGGSTLSLAPTETTMEDGVLLSSLGGSSCSTTAISLA